MSVYGVAECPLFRVLKSMEKWLRLSELSITLWGSAVEGCPLSGFHCTINNWVETMYGSDCRSSVLTAKSYLCLLRAESRSVRSTSSCDIMRSRPMVDPCRSKPCQRWMSPCVWTDFIESYLTVVLPRWEIPQAIKDSYNSDMRMKVDGNSSYSLSVYLLSCLQPTTHLLMLTRNELEQDLILSERDDNTTCIKRYPHIQPEFPLAFVWSTTNLCHTRRPKTWHERLFIPAPPKRALCRGWTLLCRGRDLWLWLDV